MKRTQGLICVSILILIFSCDFPEYYFTPEPECKSDTSNDLNQEDHEILIANLKEKDPRDFRYFFKTFREEGDKTYMVTNFRNDEFCFDVGILVDKWDKLTGMKRTNGYSFPKELYDLKWEIKSINGKDVVKYIDMHKIID